MGSGWQPERDQGIIITRTGADKSTVPYQTSCANTGAVHALEPLFQNLISPSMPTLLPSLAANSTDFANWQALDHDLTLAFFQAFLSIFLSMMSSLPLPSPGLHVPASLITSRQCYSSCFFGHCPPNCAITALSCLCKKRPGKIKQTWPAPHTAQS